MQKIKFTKMVASGNDFVVITPNSKFPAPSLKKLAQKICDRKFGVGADGLLVLEKSKVADLKMRIFNPDGSEPKMCGNGARCVALWLTENREPRTEKLSIETKAGIIQAQVRGDKVKIKLTEPKNIKLDLPIKVNNRSMRVNFIDTGVPHTVIFVEGLEKIDVFNLGRQIRYHKKFSPRGTNVDFVEVLNNNSINLRTYERGVENETLACGTGAVAAAIVMSDKLRLNGSKEIKVQTRSGEVLKVYFEKINHKFKNVWLEGKAKIVYKGVYDV
jgi:diaminopimelate epimerase